MPERFPTQAQPGSPSTSLRIQLWQGRLHQVWRQVSERVSCVAILLAGETQLGGALER